MSTFTSGARVIQEHLTNGRFSEALDVIRTITPGNGEQKKACTLVLNALTCAPHGPARDNGFLNLITLLLDIGDGGQALAALDAIGSDSHLSVRRQELTAMVDTFVERQQEAIRVQEVRPD